MIWSDPMLKRRRANDSYNKLDTDSIMLSLNGIFNDGHADIDEIVDVADGVGEIANEAFGAAVEHAFNVPKDRTHYIATAREKVWDKALFLSKKRYIVHVVDNEGHRAEKTMMTGVEIKKSDTSEAVKDILTELVGMILDDMTMDDVLARVKEIKGEYQQLPVTKIAVPNNTKTLTKITNVFNETGSLKGAHYAAKAAFMWNMYKTDFDEEIYAGQKVGLVYVKHKDFNCMAYPIDMVTFPEWFLEIPIDYDKMWAAAYKKVTNYLASVGWDITSRKTEARATLFGF